MSNPGSPTDPPAAGAPGRISMPSSPTRKGFLGFGHAKKTSDGPTPPMTPGGMVTTISQTPILESSNPMDKAHAIPTEAREQKIVGLTGEKVGEDASKVLLAMDGTEAGEKAFKYLVENKTISKASHVFLATVLPANVLSGPWVSGPLSIDSKKQNELLKQLRDQAIHKLEPYKVQLRAQGYNVTLHVLHGDARASLLRVVNFHKVDLVIIGKRNLGWKRGLTSGTVSSHLVHHSPVPVLVIK